jgi:uncharacterized alkaline shock family protein YloU
MDTDKLGTTTIAPEVIGTIARLTALATPGVSRMSAVRFPHTKHPIDSETEGVKAVVKNGQLYVDLYIVTTSEVNVRLVSETIQQRVLRAISELTGMEVAKVNVHITDIDIEA